MISCTEFIPCYSELFLYLEKKGGKEEVRRFWKYLFEPDGKGIPLINYVKKEGIRGCYSYWSGTLNEEAADFTMYLNEPAGWFELDMHHCPSKGRLLELSEKNGLTPYHDYCLHCDSYRSAAEKIGLSYIYDFRGIDRASCSLLIYDPKVFDGRIIADENTQIMDRRASQNEYFHRDFHSSMNMGIDYLGERFGEADVRAFLQQFTRRIYAAVIRSAAEDGLHAIQELIEDTYRREKAEDALELVQDETSLHVTVKYCPAVAFLHSTGREVSKWFRYTTQYVMEELAAQAGFRFEMESYDDQTGAAAYCFTQKKMNSNGNERNQYT